MRLVWMNDNICPFVSIDAECFQGLSVWEEGTFHDWIAAGAAIFGMVDDNKIVGYIAVNENSPEDVRILKLAVKPEYQRQGHGRTALERILDFCEHDGVVTLSLEVKQDNEAALSLYESLGFQIAAARVDYYGEGKHGYVMELDVQTFSSRRRDNNLSERESVQSEEQTSNVGNV